MPSLNILHWSDCTWLCCLICQFYKKLMKVFVNKYQGHDQKDSRSMLYLCEKGLCIGLLDYFDHQSNIIQHCIPLFSLSCYTFRFIWETSADCIVHDVQLLCLGGDQIEATGIRSTVLYVLDTSTKAPRSAIRNVQQIVTQQKLHWVMNKVYHH